MALVNSRNRGLECIQSNAGSRFTTISSGSRI